MIGSNGGKNRSHAIDLFERGICQRPSQSVSTERRLAGNSASDGEIAIIVNRPAQAPDNNIPPIDENIPNREQTRPPEPLPFPVKVKDRCHETKRKIPENKRPVAKTQGGKNQSRNRLDEACSASIIARVLKGISFLRRALGTMENAEMTNAVLVTITTSGGGGVRKLANRDC